MRSVLLLILAVFSANLLSAQYVVVNSPQSIAGTYTYGPASGWGADLTTDVWTGDLVAAMDGTANPNEICEALTQASASAVNGNIAVCDRGTCNFSLKALNAQNAGAIACVIFNNQAGAGVIDMGAGTFGPDVTIPVVMLSYEDGQAIRNAMAMGTVNISIGNLRFPNDLRTTTSQAYFAPVGSIPLSQVQNPGDLVFTPGSQVNNRGTNDMTNVTLTATITHTPIGGGSSTQVYQESGSLAEVPADSTQEILLPDYDAPSQSGVYNFTYNVSSDAADDAPDDNEVSGSFAILERDVFSKARWDSNTNTPVTTGGTTISTGGPIEFISIFNMPYADGLQVDSAIYRVSVNAPATLGGLATTVYLYNWEDLDLSGDINSGELSIAGIAQTTIDPAETATSLWVKVPLLDILDLEEGVSIDGESTVLVLGVRYDGGFLPDGEDFVFFGFDDGQDYTQIYDRGVANENLRDWELPYLGINSWDASALPDVDNGFLFTDHRSGSSTAIILGPDASSTKDLLSDDQVSLKVYPNPVSDKLTVDIDLKVNSSQLRYQIVSSAGNLIYQAKKEGITQDKAVFNVSNLSSGQYFFILRTDEGHKTVPFTVKK